MAGVGTYEGSLASYRRMVSRRRGCVFNITYRKATHPEVQEGFIQGPDDVTYKSGTVEVLPDDPGDISERLSGVVDDNVKLWWIGHDEFIREFDSDFVVDPKSDTIERTYSNGTKQLWQIDEASRLTSGAVWGLHVKRQGTPISA